MTPRAYVKDLPARPGNPDLRRVEAAAAYIRAALSVLDRMDEQNVLSSDEYAQLEDVEMELEMRIMTETEQLP